MDGTELVEAIRADERTELDRLGSEKALIAATGASLERADVLAVAAARSRAARDAYRAWADDEDDPRAREAFAGLADREAATHDRIAERLDGTPTVTIDESHPALEEYEGAPARVGAGMVGRPLVDDRLLLQVVNFFVNEADRSTADLFREVRADTAGLVEEAPDLLDAVCADDGDYERAREAAEAVVDGAYREYADALEGMGLDPKPVC